MESGPKRLRMICEKSANYNLIGTRWTSDKQRCQTVAFESGSHAHQEGENGLINSRFSQAPALSRGAC